MSPRPTARTPGLLVVWTEDGPACRAVPLGDRPVIVGRDADAVLSFPGDRRLSRKHAEIQRVGAELRVRDLGSRNGTWLHAQRLDEPFEGHARVVRAGSVILLSLDDVSPFDGRTSLRDDDFVHGPSLRRAIERATQAARAKDNLLLTGESGTGKEHVAEVFHHASAATGPFVVMDALSVKEADLLGVEGVALARKSLFEEADGGTLFIEEPSELSLDDQWRIAQLLERRQVQRVGGTHPRTFEAGICAGTHIDLEAGVMQGRFRRDLLDRLAARHVHLPPLRDRPEEIPWLAALWLEKRHVTASAPFIEALLLRTFRKNLRELRQVIGKAMVRAAPEGSSLPDRELGPEDLPPERMGASTLNDADPVASSPHDPKEIRDDRILETFRRLRDPAETARSLGHGPETVREILHSHALLP